MDPEIENCDESIENIDGIVRIRYKLLQKNIKRFFLDLGLWEKVFYVESNGLRKQRVLIRIIGVAKEI